MNPLISVIVPVYNVSPYLREALDSLIHQTWKNLEILLVDDGSTDGSGEICDEYTRDPRVRVFHQENRGLSGARNTGLDHMTGEYVAFFDSDDAFYPEMIERLYLALSGKHADLAVCGYDVFETEGLLKKAKLQDRIIPKKEKTLARLESICAMTEDAFPVTAWNKLYRRSLWDGLRYPEGRIYEDVRTAPQILDRCNYVSVIPEALICHRKRENSITDTYTVENFNELIAACEAVQRYLERTQPVLPLVILQKNLERSLRMMIFRWGEFRKREVANEDVRFIRKQILDFVGGKIQFGSFKTGVIWKMFLHCPGMLVFSQKGFRIFRKVTWFFRQLSLGR